MGAMAKAASPTIPTFELVFFRSLITLIVVDLLRRRSRVALAFADRPVLFSRSFAGFIGIAAYFYALKYIPLGDAVLLNNASPVLTSLGAVWLLGEHLTPTKIAAMIASMAGVWLLVAGHTGALESRGALIGALSAVASAWALVSLKFATRRNRSLIVVWSLAATCMIGSLCMWRPDWSLPNLRECALLVGTGVAAAMAQLLMTMGYRLLEASTAAIYSYMNPVFAVGMSALVFGDKPTYSTWLGGTLIIGAGAGVALIHGRSHHAHLHHH